MHSTPIQDAALRNLQMLDQSDEHISSALCSAYPEVNWSV